MDKTNKTGATILKFIAPNKDKKSELMNSMELTSLGALTAHLSGCSDISQDSIQKIIARRFGAETYRDLPRHCYDGLIRALADCVPEDPTQVTLSLADIIASVHNDESKLSKIELTSLNALTAYASHETKIEEKVIQEIISSEYGADCYSKMQGRYYEQAIDSLMNFSAKDIVTINKLPI